MVQTRDELPGADLIEAGLADLGRGVDSIPALLVSIGAPRLQLWDSRLSIPFLMPSAASTTGWRQSIPTRRTPATTPSSDGS